MSPEVAWSYVYPAAEGGAGGAAGAGGAPECPPVADVLIGPFNPTGPVSKDGMCCYYHTQICG